MYSLRMLYSCYFLFFFFFKQKTAYEMRISDWSSDVCSSDLHRAREGRGLLRRGRRQAVQPRHHPHRLHRLDVRRSLRVHRDLGLRRPAHARLRPLKSLIATSAQPLLQGVSAWRSEEHTSELQSLMRTSYADFCLKTKQNTKQQTK